LFAAWVLQCQHEQEARDRQFASQEELDDQAKTQIEARSIPGRDTTSAWLAPAPSAIDRPFDVKVKPSAPYWLSSTAISAARARHGLAAESARRFLSAAQSAWLSAVRSARQRLSRATTFRAFSWFSQRALRASLRNALPRLLHGIEVAKNKLESFASYRVKVRVPLSPRLTAEAAGASCLVILIAVAFTLFQVWHHEPFQIVAATSNVNHQSEVSLLGPTPPLQVSHRQVTDRNTSYVVAGLSRYEIRALQRQAQFGDDSAALVMGMLYETGRYLPQSCTKAADWVTRSANWGNAAAQYNLGLRYRDGDGVPANAAEADKWLRKAAEQSYSKARLTLEALPSPSHRQP
jgi:TPR repeat protein